MDGTPTSSRRHRPVIAMAIALVASVGIASVAVGLALGGWSEVDGLAVIGTVAFTLIGALIVDRRPGEPIGAICLGMGVLYATAIALRLVVIVVDREPAPLPPLWAAMAMISSMLSTLAILLSGPLIISRFPRRSTSLARRRTEDGLIAFIGLIAVLGVLRPGLLELGDLDAVPNPLGIDWLPADAGAIFTLGLVAYGTAYFVTGTGLVLRYRDGGAVDRAQIRWLAASVLASFGLLLLTVVTGDIAELNNVAYGLWIASLLMPPIAIGIAVLRYHLYDIDRIISRTLSYGLVTAILFGLFALLNVMFQELAARFLLGAGVGELQGVVVAASTLLVALLFQPIRTSVQRGVDRHFHRAAYDAERTVQALAIHLRNEVDLGDLQDRILATVRQSIEPDSAVLWLRPRATGPARDGGR